jgi:hypothetical protein
MKQPESIVPTGITKVDFVPIGAFPDSFGGSFEFEDVRGQHTCWRMGTQTADAFSTGLPDASTKKLFYTSKVKVFFPVREDYFAVRTVAIRGAATTERVLRAVESTAALAMAHHIIKDLGKPKATQEDVRRLLRPLVCCHLFCRRIGGGNHVYVRLQ